MGAGDRRADGRGRVAATGSGAFSDLTILAFGDGVELMMTTFHDEETHKVWEGEFSKKLPVQIQAVARRKLRIIYNARSIEDLQSKYGI